MNWIVVNSKWIMLVSGIITCSMLLVTISPSAGLLNTFGETLPDASIMQIVVRNWGALIGLIGGMLIYGACNPINRTFILAVAGISKIILFRWCHSTAVYIWGKRVLQWYLIVSLCFCTSLIYSVCARSRVLFE